MEKHFRRNCSWTLSILVCPSFAVFCPRFHLSLPFRLAIKYFTNACIIKPRKARREKDGKRANKISLMATQIFCLLFFSSIILLPFTLFFPFVRLSFLFTDISRLTQNFFLLSGGKVTGISKSGHCGIFFSRSWNQLLKVFVLVYSTWSISKSLTNYSCVPSMVQKHILTLTSCSGGASR